MKKERAIAKRDFTNAHSFVSKTFLQQMEDVITAEATLRKAEEKFAKAKKPYTDNRVANKQSNPRTQKEFYKACYEYEWIEASELKSKYKEDIYEPLWDDPYGLCPRSQIHYAPFGQMGQRQETSFRIQQKLL